MPEFNGFSPELLKFLKQLSKNNERDWFQQNKPRFESCFMEPALDFIRAMEKPLQKVSPHFTAVAKRSGGSLMRIYRDTRFSKNKAPYKTNMGIHFRHEVGKDVHAPGFYFHIAPGEIFFGAGVWHPDSGAISMIREAIDEDSARWKRIVNGKTLKNNFERHGESLKRPPRGYEKDHPMIDELKRKDHLVLCHLEESDLYDPNLVKLIVERMKQTRPMLRFLCDALHLPS